MNYPVTDKHRRFAHEILQACQTPYRVDGLDTLAQRLANFCVDGPPNMFAPYEDLRSESGGGGIGCIAVQLRVAASRFDPEKDKHVAIPMEQWGDEVQNAAMDAIDGVRKAMTAQLHKTSPASQARRASDRAQIIGLFPAPIYVEEIPNGYCSDACCKHLPWFIVTTSVGRIKIGWRKRVINIDWSDTVCTKTGTELFPNDDVTKGGRYIHAWKVEDAKRYIDTVIASVAECAVA
jgi:hypothetical protein